MRSSRAFIIAATIIGIITIGTILVITVKGTQEGDDSVYTEPLPGESSSTAPEATPSTELSEPSAGRLEYVVPSEASDACGVVDGLLELNAQAATQSTDASIAQLEERLRLIADATGALSTLMDSEDDRTALMDASERYRDAADFLNSAGGQISNDTFISLLGEAVVASDAAYGGIRDTISAECGTSVDPLIGQR